MASKIATGVQSFVGGAASVADEAARMRDRRKKKKEEKKDPNDPFCHIYPALANVKLPDITKSNTRAGNPNRATLATLS